MVSSIVIIIILMSISLIVYGGTDSVSGQIIGEDGNIKDKYTNEPGNWIPGSAQVEAGLDMFSLVGSFFTVDLALLNNMGILGLMVRVMLLIGLYVGLIYLLFQII